MKPRLRELTAAALQQVQRHRRRHGLHLQRHGVQHVARVDQHNAHEARIGALQRERIPGLLTLNVGGVVLATVTGSLDANGAFVVPGPIPPTAPSPARLYCQGFVLDPTSGGEAFASSQGLDLVTQ